MKANSTRVLVAENQIRQGFFLAMMALLGLILLATAARAQIVIENGHNSGRHVGEIVVPLNKSQILRTQEPFTEIMIGNAEIADVIPLTNQSAYVLGRALGNTSITVYGAGRKLLAVGDLVVGYDVAGLKAKLYEVLPDERIEVRSVNDSVLLKGQVSDAPSAARAMAIAESYAPGKVQNGMSVAASQQVMLQVRFAEVARSVGKALGVSLDVADASGDFTFSALTSGGVADAFASLGLGATIGSIAIDAVLDALESKDLLHRLAEPNLVVLSGETASFLAGGEFPVPVSQDNDSITVEFKEFGVSLSFTPTVLGDGLINLAVRPEVSSIDPTRDFVVPGVNAFTVPGLITRRAETTVELRDGQSFAIAGLYDSTYSNAIQQFPWLGDIPILGALFRSSDFQQEESELVIIITPRLVKPAQSPDDLRVPTDLYLRPNEAEFFLMGNTVHQGGPAAAAPTAAGTAGGMAGDHGYILK